MKEELSSLTKFSHLRGIFLLVWSCQKTFLDQALVFLDGPN